MLPETAAYKRHEGDVESVRNATNVRAWLWRVLTGELASVWVQSRSEASLDSSVKLLHPAIYPPSSLCGSAAILSSRWKFITFQDYSEPSVVYTSIPRSERVPVLTSGMPHCILGRRDWPQLSHTTDASQEGMASPLLKHRQQGTLYWNTGTDEVKPSENTYPGLFVSNLTVIVLYILGEHSVSFSSQWLAYCLLTHV